VISDENGMGAALGDYDGDGAVDWFVSGIFDADGVAEGDWGTSGNRLYHGLGDGDFVDATDVAGVREGDWVGRARSRTSTTMACSIWCSKLAGSRAQPSFAARAPAFHR